VDRVGIVPGRLVSGADLAATFVFAVEGAIVAAAAGLDWFGVLVLGFVSALVGGVIRDVLLGDLPPASLCSARYAALAFLGGGIVIAVDEFVRAVPLGVVTTLDAAGLALFAMVGTSKALDHDINELVAVLLGTTSAVGGGVVRDVLLDRIPVVLREDIYAVAAAAGAVAGILALRLGVPRAAAMSIGFVVCFTLRVLSVALRWNLPHVPT
jgi:uncharacterized membrane protein YeiH